MSIYYLAFIILWSTPGYSTSPSSPKKISSEEIDNTGYLIKVVRNLHLSKRFSDVGLIVGEERLPAHRIILALSSTRFRELFYGDLKDDKLDVVISETPVNLFKILLEYIYTGQIQENILEETDVFQFLEMLDHFGISNLESRYRLLLTSKKNFNKRIDHTNLLISGISSLYLSGMFSDAILKVCGEEIPVHRFLLASYSEYFRFLFYGGLNETYVLDVKIGEEPLTLFQTLLEYIYKGRIDLSDFEDKVIFELYKMSDYFCVSNLNRKLYVYFQNSMKADNVCSFLNTAILYEIEELKVLSLRFIEHRAIYIVLRKKDFLNLSSGALLEILNRDSFYAEELDIFHTVCSWIQKNQDQLDSDTTIKVLSAVRYSLMSDEEMSQVRESRLVSSDIISNAIQIRKTWSSNKPKFRGQLNPDVNLRYQTRGSSDINAIGGGITMIKLDYPSTINYILAILWYKDEVDHEKCHSYYVEVSMDALNWIRVIDHSNYNCRTYQRLWIQPQIVRYIRFVGTNKSINATYKVLEVQYVSRMHELRNGLVVPKYNVILFKGAIVIKGENSVNGSSLADIYSDDKLRNAQYTYHLLGSGSIVLHLAQPFIIGSMSMLLWGGDIEAYSYTIETSINNKDWDMAVNKSNEHTRSWQDLTFKPRPMLYIRITGVRSSVGNEFRVVYLEAPAKVTLDANYVEDDRPESSARTEDA